jgi:hypothetical protein
MQVIVQTAMDVQRYVELDWHREVQAPSVCPNCGKAARFRHLGYYQRYVQDALAAHQIKVKRFPMQGV